MFKKTLVASALAAAALSAQASSVVMIDPDGSAAANGSYAVAGLDWNAGTTLITPTGVNLYGQTPSANAAQPMIGDVVQTYAQASLSKFNGNTGPVAVNGLDSAYEWTFVAGFQELISNFIGVPGAGTIVLDTIGGGDNFFRVYQSAADSNSLSGTGYNNGNLVLEGIVLGYNAGTQTGRTTFTTIGVNTNPLDNYLGDDYPGITSVTGFGSATLDLKVTSFNADYITGLAIGENISMTFNTQVADPFYTNNPSAAVTKGDNTLISATSLGSIGAVNGITGPNLVLQNDGSTAFNVPEPASLALVSVAMLGLGASRRRSAK